MWDPGVTWGQETITDRILCDTLRQKLTSLLEVPWANHVFPGQGLRV